MTVSDSGFLKRRKKRRFQHRHHHCRATAALCLKKKKQGRPLCFWSCKQRRSIILAPNQWKICRFAFHQIQDHVSNRQRNFFPIVKPPPLVVFWSDPIVFITVLIEFCFRAPRCRSICNTLTVISFLSSTQRNHPWWNFNQPSGILLQTCLSSSSPMDPQCNPTSTHCEIMATPQPPTPIRVNKTWHALFCFRDNFYIFPALHNWGPCLKFRRLRVSPWREWSQLWTDEPGCWLKMKITSERAGIMSIPTIGFEKGAKTGGKSPKVPSEAPLVSHHILHQLFSGHCRRRSRSHKSVIICSRVSVRRSFF